MIALEILLEAQFKIKIITVVTVMETQLMLFHQWNQQKLLKQLKLPRSFQPQLQLEKSKRELNHPAISKIKTINLPGKSYSNSEASLATCRHHIQYNLSDIDKK